MGSSVATCIDIRVPGTVQVPALCVNSEHTTTQRPSWSYCSKSRTPEVCAVAWMLTKRVNEMM